MELNWYRGPDEELLRTELCVDSDGCVCEGFGGLDEDITFSGSPACKASHFELLQKLHRDDLLLEERELLADAAARARGEGHVRKGVGRTPLPPLWDEGCRVGTPSLWIHVQSKDVHGNRCTLLDLPLAAEHHVLLECHALEAACRRQEAQRLLQAPIQVIQLTEMVLLHLPIADNLPDLLSEFRLHLRIRYHEHDERGHGSSCRVVPSEEEGQDLAADVLFAQA
mmetsp:Transcript_30688/g.77562  ORF Transcript_30688/g.77562 Transcript_30688/m.77562 type:complete len:225 (+) Transcript_30688:129-803(+)